MKILPFTKIQIEEIAKSYPTPFYIYDEQGIRDNARKFYKAFRTYFPNFKNYFAVKACPNPSIMKILKEEGMLADCSALSEFLLAEKIGITGENVMFTSNDTPLSEFVKAKEMGAILNLDDISHIDFVDKNIGLPDLICMRYNPGSIIGGGNYIIGHPEESKYGFTKAQLFDGYKRCMELGVKRFALHTMLVSNELNVDHLIDTARILFELVVEIHEKLGIHLEFVNIGGGVGIPYLPDEPMVDYDVFAKGIADHYDTYIKKNNLDPINLVMECGRVITGPYGYLVSKVLHLKYTYKKYVGLDACMANLMRPALYGAYHHITVLGKENQNPDCMYDVTGSLCENNDKFAIDRMLPNVEVGDLVVIHDAGAHGHTMGFQYNGKLRSSELLLQPDGIVKQIRRAETMDDYFAALDFSSL